MGPYVRWRRSASYDHIHLLSYGDLRRSLKAAFGREWRVVIPDVSAYGVSTTVKRILNGVNEIRPIRPVLVQLSPVHLVLARRA
jgi:hypothetical protein